MSYILLTAAVILIMMWFSTGCFTWAKFMWCCGEPYSKRKGFIQHLKYFAVTLGLIFGWPVFYAWLWKHTSCPKTT